jgi:hypothetical protein
MVTCSNCVCDYHMKLLCFCPIFWSVTSSQHFMVTEVNLQVTKNRIF